jgi:hypothetical protein
VESFKALLYLSHINYMTMVLSLPHLHQLGSRTNRAGYHFRSGRGGAQLAGENGGRGGGGSGCGGRGCGGGGGGGGGTRLGEFAYGARVAVGGGEVEGRPEVEGDGGGLVERCRGVVDLVRVRGGGTAGCGEGQG